MARTNEILHVIIAFNQHDAKELERLASDRVTTAKSQRAKIELSPDSTERDEKAESSNIEHSESAKLSFQKLSIPNPQKLSISCQL